jgi:hypothetical protein
MRTTLTLEPDVAARLKKRAQRDQVPFKRVVNDAIRAGLDAAEKGTKRPKYRVRPMALGIKPGIDMDKINQVLDEMEVEAFRRKLSAE